MFPFRLIDLTHELSEGIPTWDGLCGFSRKTVLTYEECATPTKFCVQSFAMAAGIGTHVDAPRHCFSDGLDVGTLLLDQLCAPCVVIDVSHQATGDFLLSSDDIEHFEKKHGAIAQGSFVLVRTGWSTRWADQEAFRNDMRFPAVAAEVSELLVQRQVVGIGVETLSPDRPDSDFPTHRILLGAGKFIVENVANLELMPQTGAFCLVAPLKIKDATEAPVRLIGFVPR